ncbi:MAG: carbohydrate ABC transporter permease [Chloroflexi bacterium]|nr:carbohydrate ABC transporter permease [Chloroflexota bacterium]
MAAHVYTRRRNYRKYTWDVIAFLLLVIGLVYLLLPLVWLVLTAFKLPLDAFANPPRFISPVTLDNFKTLLSGQFLTNLGHSAILTVLATAVAMGLGAPAGYAFARSRVPGQQLITGWLVASYITPAVVFIIPMYIIFSRLGLLNNYIGLVLAYETGLLPFTIWMMRSYFSDIPRELDEAAWVDGCSKLRAFFTVIMPVAWPGVSTVAILVALASWGEYFGALILSGPSTMTAPVAIFSFVGILTANWSAMAAGGVLVVLPMFVATMFVQRGLIRGLTVGAVK